MAVIRSSQSPLAACTGLLRFVGLTLATVWLPACKGEPTAETSTAASASTPAAAAKGEHFGGAFTGAPTVALGSLLAAPAEYESKLVSTGGTVRRACSAKGCWMELGEGEGACRVTFKDYGFFVPTNSAGAQAKVEGTLQVQRVPAARVSHLEAEGATFTHKNADGSALEARLVANAVELTR